MISICLQRFVIWALCTFACSLHAQSLYPEFRFQFALIGDTPYDDQQETNYFPNMIEEINRTRLAFVIHDGDIKAGATPCTDELFERRLKHFQLFDHPLIYIYGDNEWKDCPKLNGARVDPLERLEKLRSMFSAGDRSLGRRTLLLERQSSNPAFASFRENVRWVYGGILFAGLNVPGSDNNYGSSEFASRNAANLAWMRDAFAIAQKQNLRAVMLIIQANPHFDLGATNRVRRGFNEMLNLLEDLVVNYGRPVVLVHGDSHYFRIDQPMMSPRSGRRVENFTRVETYGNPDVHWLRVSVDWRDPNVFTFHRQLVRKNFIDHRRKSGG